MEQIALLLSVLILPATMLCFGFWYRRHAPKTMRAGYRTRRSMLSEETWNFSHRLLGKYWRRLGGPTAVVSIAAFLIVIDKSETVMVVTVALLTALQCVVMAASFVAVERALKQHFDEDGVPYEAVDWM